MPSGNDRLSVTRTTWVPKSTGCGFEGEWEADRVAKGGDEGGASNASRALCSLVSTAGKTLEVGTENDVALLECAFVVWLSPCVSARLSNSLMASGLAAWDAISDAVRPPGAIGRGCHWGRAAEHHGNQRHEPVRSRKRGAGECTVSTCGSRDSMDAPAAEGHGALRSPERGQVATC